MISTLLRFGLRIAGGFEGTATADTRTARARPAALRG
jgi:hypothetical protein